MASYDYENTMRGIMNGDIDSIMVIIKSTYSIDSDGDMEIEEAETFFAGTTILECQQEMGEVESNCEPGQYEEIQLTAISMPVSKDCFEEYEEEYDDAELTLTEYINEYAFNGDYDNVGTSDWNYRTVSRKYESLIDSILVYWRWERHVGYARKLIRLEYCEDANLTELDCAPVDQVFKTQITRLLTPDDVESCTCASDLRILIEQRLDDMGKWNSLPYADKFVEDLYHDAEINPMSYKLPKNDL